jgi:hypothetical protein
VTPAGDTVAVNVTGDPLGLGFALELRVTLVGIALTVRVVVPLDAAKLPVAG